jgi:hypothetical protein
MMGKAKTEELHQVIRRFETPGSLAKFNALVRAG